MRQLWVIAGLLLVWGYLSGTAHAFEQRPPAPVTPQSELTSSEDKNADESRKNKLQLKATGDSVGAKWTIPGLGSLDFLPKMNFGLELLYSDDADSYVDDGSGGDDVRIKGSVKRRF